jgi:hypothetical protein
VSQATAASNSFQPFGTPASVMLNPANVAAEANHPTRRAGAMNDCAIVVPVRYPKMAFLGAPASATRLATEVALLAGLPHP